MNRANCIRTGRGVVLGGAYIPPAPLMDSDACAIQRALIGRPEKRALAGVWVVASLAIAAAVLLVL